VGNGGLKTLNLSLKTKVDVSWNIEEDAVAASFEFSRKGWIKERLPLLLGGFILSS
jgi:hypothetical protein